MKPKLRGTFETVPFRKNESLLMYLNNEYEDYDTHWHSAAELIMPIENDYQVTIGRQIFHLGESDILFIPPGVLHSLQAPAQGRRMIFLFNFSPITSLQDFSSLLAILSQPILLSSLDKDTHTEAVRLIQQMIDIYPDRTEPLRVAMI